MKNKYFLDGCAPPTLRFFDDVEGICKMLAVVTLEVDARPYFTADAAAA